MKPSRQISANELISDIRSGMAASELMSKYSLSPRELQFLVQKLMTATGKSLAELYGRSSTSETGPEARRMRVLPRHELDLPVPIHDAKRPQVTGTLLDITEKGFRIQGIETGIDDIKTFIILADQFFPVNPFKVEAVCRWARPTDDDRKCVAGFERTTISDTALQELRKFVKALSRAKQASRKGVEPVPSDRSDREADQTDSIWICPFCKMPQNREFDECPQCGIITSKYKNRMQRSKSEIVSLIENRTPGDPPPKALSEEYVSRTFYLSNKLWKQLEALGGVPDDHVNEALSSYLLKAKVSKYDKWH
jgi:hypothetical protein